MNSTSHYHTHSHTRVSATELSGGKSASLRKVGSCNVMEMLPECVPVSVVCTPSFIIYYTSTHTCEDPHMFDRSLIDNVAYGCQFDSDAERLARVVEACKTAQIHAFIMTLEMKYDTEIGKDGTRLSGGMHVVCVSVCVCACTFVSAAVFILPCECRPETEAGDREVHCEGPQDRDF
jgi:hypothetical protein